LIEQSAEGRGQRAESIEQSVQNTKIGRHRVKGEVSGIPLKRFECSGVPPDQVSAIMQRY